MSLAGVPEPLRGARFVPLYRGVKASRLSGGDWQRGLTWEPTTDEYLLHKGDLGVRLEASSPPLLVIDADRTLEYVSRVEGSSAHFDVVSSDGRERLHEWAKRERVFPLPRTLALQTPGRGTPERPAGGWHLYYQCHGGHRLRNAGIDDKVELKVNGIARLTPDMTVLDDHPIALAGAPLMRALAGLYARKIADWAASEEGTLVPVDRYRKEGIPMGQQHDELLRSANSLVARELPRAEIVEWLHEIIQHSEQDERRPWREQDVEFLVDDAITWVNERRAVETGGVDVVSWLSSL